MIEWYSSPELRDRCRVGLNKGEAGHKLTRAVFFHERGEIRDGSLPPAADTSKRSSPAARFT